MRFPKTLGSLRLRVAVSSALVAALAGLCAAVVAAQLVDELSTAAEDKRLVDSASVIHNELASQGLRIEQHVEEEAVAFGHVGVRVALFERGAWQAGARDVHYPDEEGCFSRSEGKREFRTCTFGEETRRIVVTAPRTGRRQQGELFLAVGAASLLAALASAFGSSALSGWALSPLTALGEKLQQVTISSPAEADLGVSSGSGEVDALRTTIRELLQRLGTALDRSRTFAANAAHELRTPLATMMAELDLAREKAPSLGEPLARVRRTVGRLSVLVERLLVLASETSSSSLMHDAVAMEDVVRDVVLARPESDRERVQTTFEGPGMVRGDETLLSVLVDNLLDNALKFSRDKPVLIRVLEHDGRVSVVVEDDGPGIDPSEADRLMMPFARGAEDGVPGHGLGLAIAAHAARLHEGDVRFVPRERGAELLVTLPAWTPERA